MSFQAYLDAIEKKTGKTPQQLVDEAHAKGFGPDTKAGEMIAWLAADHGLGRGHAMALVHVVKNGPGISDTHVGSTGTHRDESAVLRLDGIALRDQPAS
jgi:predicted NAD/FAD-dependent oxidoreductase